MDMKNEDTNYHYSKIAHNCLELFLKKAQDYGTAWRILRQAAVIDQISIKLQRIRTIQEAKTQKINDSLHEDFIGIVNYAIIGLMQLDLETEPIQKDMSLQQIQHCYLTQLQKAQDLMLLKNHDYGEAWRSMSEISFVDLMLMKVHRMRQIMQNGGKTIMSEGITANYLDMINYAIFVQILFYPYYEK